MSEEPFVEEEHIEERNDELWRLLGISQLAYPQMRAAALLHAFRPPVAGDPDWLSVGPRNVGGRIVALAQDPNDTAIVYAGSAHGGLWRTIDAGDTWEHLGGPEHNAPVAAIAVANSSTLYVGTGSHDARHVSGQGLYRVTLAGPRAPAMFTPLASAPAAFATPHAATDGAALRYTRIEVDPEDPNQFWAASQTGLWRCKLSGAALAPTWRRDFPPGAGEPAGTPQLSDGAVPSTGHWPPYATDLRVVTDPRDRARSRDGRTARYLIIYVGISGFGVYRGRYDRDAVPARAVTWDDDRAFPRNPLPNAFSRVALAICRSRPQHVFAVMANDTGFGNPEDNHATAVYRSDDNGDSWRPLGKIPRAYLYADQTGPPPVNKRGQAGYDLVLEVNPDNPDVVVCGEIDLCRSEDGGTSWVPIMTWQVYNDGDYAQHADQHAVMFDAADRKRLWAGNDGGLSVARDLHAPAAAPGFWRKRSHGIVVGQFQDVAASPNPAFHFMSGGGLHDNGTWVSFGGPTWYYIGGGDGGTMAIHAGNPRLYLFGPQNQSAVAAITDQSGGFLVNPVVPDIPSPNNSMFVKSRRRAIPGSGPFVSLFDQDPTTPGRALVGWKALPGAAPPPPPPVAYWTAAPTVTAAGVLVAGAATAIALPGPAITAGEEASAVTFGPVVPAVATVFGWIGTTDGRLFWTDAAPAVNPWREATAALPAIGVLRSIARISVHPTNPNIVAVAAIPTVRPARVTILPGAAQFQVELYDPTENRTRPPSGPIAIPAAGKSVALPGTMLLVEFPTPAYAAGETWEFDSAGTITTASVHTIRAVATQSKVITVQIHTGGALGVATFTYHAGAAVGAAGAIAPAGPLVTSDAVEVPGTELVLSFAGGPFVAGHRWTIALDNTIAPVGAAAGALTLVARLHGRVFLTWDGGTSWTDVSYPGTPPGAGDQTSLPPCVITSVKFDIDVTNPAAPVLSLYAGTLVGIYRLTAIPPAAPPALPDFPWNWRPFNGTAQNHLPLTLVTDIERIEIPPRRILRVATFGRGIWDCELTGAPRYQLFIRQTLIENGRVYPRVIPPAGAVGGNRDYRLPVAIAPVYDFTHAFDIRVDSRDLGFFEDRVDGVEFDEQIGVDQVVPKAANAVYVQVHNSGWDGVPDVTVHLFFMPSGAAPLENPAAFWNRPGFTPAAGGAWQRVAPPQTLRSPVKPYEPVVARFDWVPPETLAGGQVALLAVCTAPADAVAAAQPAGKTVAQLVEQERRTALRIVPVGPLPPRHVYIRDGVDDSGRLGETAFSGRSPDIIVMPANLAPADANAARAAFKDLLDHRPQDRIRGSVENAVFVRVHNAGPLEASTEVHLWAVKLDSNNAPAAVQVNAWTRLTPEPATPANTVTVPPHDAAYVRVSWAAGIEDPNPADAVYDAYALVALIRSVDPVTPALSDPLPDTARITSVETFWTFFGEHFDSDNAALRVLRYEP